MPTPPDTVFAVDAVLFDSDGVLVDSEPSVVRAWTALARRYGLDPDAVLAVVHGRRAADTIKELLPADVVAEATAYIDRIELDDAGRTTAIPGAGPLLRSMPAGRWAVVTSGVRPLALARLRAAGLPLPEVVVTGEDVARGKPAPDAYLRAAERLGVDPGRALVVEDSGSGIQAGRAAGVAAVLGVGERAAPYRPDAVVPDLTAVRWSASAGSPGSAGSAGSPGGAVVVSGCRD